MGSKIFKHVRKVATCELGVHQKDLGWIVVHYKGHKMAIVHFERCLEERSAL